MRTEARRFPPRPMEEVRAELLSRAKEKRNPFLLTIYDEVAPVIERLRSVDREEWAEAFSALAKPHEEKAAAAEAAGDTAAAMKHYMIAYDCYHVARYPAPNSPGKLAAYRKSQDNFLKAARYLDPPLERVEMPFKGRPGEGTVSVGYLRKPKGVERPPIVVVWGGIDAFKEERRVEPLLKAGIAVLTIDMPGVADAPLAGSEDAERLWDAVFDWIDSRPDIDSKRKAVHGGSTGGYWATKVAHTHRERLCAAVNQGGPAHFAFEEQWIVKAQRGEYPFELAETLACAFGRSTAEEWVEYAPRLSLLDQGILDRPCAPLLCVNGVNDSVFPIADMYLLLEHGDPKSARFFHAGHMGGSAAPGAIVEWLKGRLGSRAR
ncbi:MAG TPA: alpha/beta hydrolase [Candidatus Acidoferrales bacterium]|nr:alpha/beta hydrolase [Candidatus Acidoferrales bacterium]